jgi:hypothetical protein
MSDVTEEVHDLSRPLTGAFFDVLAFLYLERLYEEGLVGRDVRDAARDGQLTGARADMIQTAFDRAYANRHFQFKSALELARDTLGSRLASTWQALSPEELEFEDVAKAFCECDSSVTSGEYKNEIPDIFRWREIF